MSTTPTRNGDTAARLLRPLIWAAVAVIMLAAAFAVIEALLTDNDVTDITAQVIDVVELVVAGAFGFAGGRAVSRQPGASE